MCGSIQSKRSRLLRRSLICHTMAHLDENKETVSSWLRVWRSEMTCVSRGGPRMPPPSCHLLFSWPDAFSINPSFFLPQRRLILLFSYFSPGSRFLLKKRFISYLFFLASSHIISVFERYSSGTDLWRNWFWDYSAQTLMVWVALMWRWTIGNWVLK